MPCCAELRSSGFGMPAWPPCLPPMSRSPSKSFALAILRTPVGHRSWSWRCRQCPGPPLIVRLRVTACQGCVSANLYPRCAALVQPGAKIQLPDLQAGPLAPKADTLARRFPVCWVQPRRFLRVGARPSPSGVLGLTRWNVRASCETGRSGSSPPEAVGSSPRLPHKTAALRDSLPNKTKAMRALHRMAFAGTVPLLAKIPSPLT
jgi:hypothetical protein